MPPFYLQNVNKVNLNRFFARDLSSFCYSKASMFRDAGQQRIGQKRTRDRSLRQLFSKERALSVVFKRFARCDFAQG